ncbi:MAG: DUF2330 domain-containing protein [Armatimonadota bacterium]|nr:DUF2330 domain-containing protein [Armatimonadota bacterium]
MRDLCLVLALLILPCVPSLADGGFFPPVHGVANTADQRAVVIDHGDAETIVLQTAYDGDASDFAWVIPVPALISAAQAVGTTAPALFDTLDQLTAPRHVGAFTGSSGLCGCSGSGGPEQRFHGVTVWETLRVDDYEVAVLSADESADLAQWLGDNGYHLPTGSEDTLRYYVDRDSFFVALKIAPAAQQADETGRDGAPGDNFAAAEELRPITLTFATDELVFPMRISRLSTRERVEVLLYVLGPDRDYFLTRLRTRLSPEQMTEDIAMVPADADAHFEVMVDNGLARARGTMAFALMIAGVSGMTLRWRRLRAVAWTSALLGVLLLLV